MKSKHKKVFKELLMELYIEGAEDGAKAMPPGMDIFVDWDIVNEAAITYIDYYLDEVAMILTDKPYGVPSAFADKGHLVVPSYGIKDLDKSTKAIALDKMSKWIESGKPFSALEKSFSGIFGKSRAEMVAATEVTRIYADANYAAWLSTGGLVHGMKWQTVVDDLVCPICGPLHDTWTSLERGFDFTQEMIDKNHDIATFFKGTPTTIIKPPAHPRCRCYLLPVVLGVEDVIELAESKWSYAGPKNIQEKKAPKKPKKPIKPKEKLLSFAEINAKLQKEALEKVAAQKEKSSFDKLIDIIDAEDAAKKKKKTALEKLVEEDKEKERKRKLAEAKAKMEAKALAKRAKAGKLTAADVLKKVKGWYEKGISVIGREGYEQQYNVFSYSSKSGMKDSIAKTVSKMTNLPYERVNEFIHQWAISSNDSDMRSLYIQKVASEVFDVPMSEWQQSRYDEINYYRKNAIRSGYGIDEDLSQTDFEDVNNVGQVTIDTKNKKGIKQSDSYTPRQAVGEVVQAIYDNTQKELKELKDAGVTHIKLYRGVVENDRAVANAMKHNTKATRDQNVLESWALDPAVSYQFSVNDERGKIFEAEVAIEDIYSTSKSGVGCLDEWEFVVKANPNRVEKTYDTQKFFDDPNYKPMIDLAGEY